MSIHLNTVKGDYVFSEWEDKDWKKFKKTVQFLRENGFRKIGQENDYHNHYQFYRQKGKKKVVTVTWMCM